MTGSTYQVDVSFNLKSRFTGFLVDFNPGECAVASPLLQHNNMPLASQLGQVLFRNYVLSEEYPTKMLALFDVDHPRVVEATAGFYLPVKRPDTANGAVSVMSTVLEGLHNHRSSWHQRYHDRLQFHGSPLNGYWELERKHHKLKFYALNAPDHWLRQPSKVWAEEVSLPAEFKAFCQHFVFVEVTVDRNWLKKHNLTEPSAWEGGERSGYDLMWALVRQDFGLDDPLTTEAPDAKALELLSAQDREVVTDYLYRAGDPRGAAMLMQAGEAPKHAFKQLCQRVKAATGLNLAIPWRVVETKLKGRDLNAVLVRATDFGLPMEYERYVFGSPRHELKLPTLEELEQSWVDATGAFGG